MPPVVNITLSIPPAFAWQSAKWWQDPERRATIFARFWSRVNRGESEACWTWTGATNGRGYGSFNVVTAKPQLSVRAHRFAWLMSRGEIPAGLEVCHRCDNTRCVNPGHLFLGTHQENHLDAVRKGRKRAWGLQKLDARQVLEIRARCAAGALQKDVARAFGISRNHVSSIVHRTSWAHLPASDSATGRQASCGAV